MPTTIDSCRPSTYRKSSGRCRNIGSSVDPGLPNTVVMPNDLRRLITELRTVVSPIMPIPPGCCSQCEQTLHDLHCVCPPKSYRYCMAFGQRELRAFLAVVDEGS